MTPEEIHQKIAYGYAKASFKLGSTFDHYRSATPVNPIDEDNLVGTIQLSVSVSWDYMKASNYNNSVFNACIDAQSASDPHNAKVGDYLIPGEDSDDQNTYFVQSLQVALPPRVVQCNRILTIVRPSQTTGAGDVGYAGYTQATSEAIMSGMPASVLKNGKSSFSDTKLPTDTKQPSWLIFMPNLGNVMIRIGDIITDDSDEEYVVSENELTGFGWRIVAIQVVNSR